MIDEDRIKAGITGSEKYKSGKPQGGDDAPVDFIYNGAPLRVIGKWPMMKGGDTVLFTVSDGEVRVHPGEPSRS